VPVATRTERARAFDRGLRLAATATAVELPYGHALRHPDLDWRDFNCLNVTGPVDVATLLADADRLLPGLTQRFFVVEPPEVAELLQDGLAAAGFERKRSAYLAFEGAVPTERDPRVEAVDPVQLRALRHEWLLDEAPRPEIAASGLKADVLLFGVVRTRGFCVRGADGAPAAMALLMGDGETQMVEDVYTTPSARGAGLAAALVRHAVMSAQGADLVFLPTDPDGQAYALYERLGFREFAQTALFWRE
jgi:GNAT superfamily N-acetyltransferase